MTALDARSARTRYLVLVGLRWLPTGLLIPVMVLLALSRGLSLTEIGFVFSLQGLVVLFLELPTGGLTDALGRRPVLILASLVGVASMGLLYVADSVALFAAAMILQGIFRALDSGPLEAWYVDATLAADPTAEMEHGLSAGSTVLSLAIASYALVFMTFVVFEVPGLGIAHLFYLPVAALALTGGVKRGILAGAIAVALFTLGVIINPNISPSELLTLSTPLRFLTYATMGGLLGWFSARDRELVERLRVLAERDFLTGLPNTRAFEAAIARRFEAGIPFALLLGDMDGLKTINDSQGHAEGNDALRRLALMLGSSLRPEDEVARVGGDEFAVLTVLGRTDEAAALAAKLESAMARQGSRITFGWAVYPADGENALSLYRAADERLYARKLVRGERAERTLYPVGA